MVTCKWGVMDINDFNDIVEWANSKGPRKPMNIQAAFMQRAIGTIHRVWFKSGGVSWPQVVELCEKEMGYEDRVSWDWYLDHAVVAGLPPDIAFLRDDTQWNLTIQDILYTPLNKMSIFKHWKDEQPAEDGLVFPIVNREAIIRPLNMLEEVTDAIVKFYNGEYYCIQPLKDFAAKYTAEDFIKEDTYG